MSRYINFITPENIEISYELAGIGSRFLAALVDLLIQLAVIIAINFGLMELVGVSLSLLIGMNGFFWVKAVIILLDFIVLTGYHAMFEIRWAGQTPGKKIMHLRVVRDGGWPIDPYSSIVRNLVRMVDALAPPPYGAGLLCIFFSNDYKRIGDWAAGTIVIKERDASFGGKQGLGPASPMVSYFLSVINSADALNTEEFNAIRRFTERRHELAIPIQAHIAMRLVLPLMPRMGLTELVIPVQWHYADLLEAIERKYIQEHGLL